MALTKVPSNLDATVATTQSASDNSTNVATTAYVTTALSNLVDSSPSALNTLNELAAALNDDASFSTTVNNSIATKSPLANPTFTTAINGGDGVTLQLGDNQDIVFKHHASGYGHLENKTGTFYIDSETFTIRTDIDDLETALFIDANQRVGINQVPGGNNFTLQVTGRLTDGTDGRAAKIKGFGTQTSIGSTGPTLVIQNANTTANNYVKLSFESGNAGETVSINAQNIDHTNHYGDMAFNTRGSGGYSEKARIKANGHLEFNPVNSFVGLNNSILSSSNTYLYMMGGAAGLYLANNSGLDSSIGIRDANYIDFNTNSGEKMRLDSNGVLGIAANGARYASRLSVGVPPNRTPGTVFTSTPSVFYSEASLGNSVGDAQKIASFAGEDGSNVSGLAVYRYRRAAGTNWTGDGFSLRQEVDNSANIYDYINFAAGKVGIGTPLPAQTLSVNGTIGIGTNASVGIGSTMADANIAELGPGYLNLARDDTADAKQISFSKNGVRVSDISTTDKGILWQVLESSGNAAAFQVTNGVGQSVWDSMNAQGHKWQDNVYNAFSVGGMSMGTDSSNTSHMWWNVYDTGSKHGVSAGYGMDEYVSNSTGDYSIRMSDSSGFVGDGVVLTERYRFTNKGGLNIYGNGSHQEATDAKLNIDKNSSNDWSIILSHGSDDYGYLAKGNGGYALGVYNQPSSAYRARINYNGEIFLNGGSSAVFNINSDVRLKEDITDCPSQWDLIKGLPLQKFHWKDRREGDKWSYGFIAQEVEKTNPEFVHVVPQDKEDFDNGIEDPEYKTVSEGQIHERALVALQEAMVRIEALEAEVAALKE